ncbi:MULTISPECIES: lipopolysaccharide biosynthesis protein [Sphingomonas]|jgi:O-antigen/teichoic acid export membrane protein|uniref:Oligosaccharide flippase family protein n=1 Tax=Sphingomonas zeae TaxID=1646122 RepID=A0A7Y6B353_9SPHN|nr:MULTISPECIES: oligosaccharide flippase family protein [Sphingomonas]MBB4049073.1 O-antigen/teichoic acid export membrane protein [Sphingomonas zeae]MDK8187043.1 oligosaccharide flippase family protein [Sphingomonas zeae]MDK8217767.1 oligosaccharide flippase family protein [Sphingomonas sp. UMB7805-LC452B]NUU46539.1 oligosaccharide flippase family protein [Sphingomonas zeae]
MAQTQDIDTLAKGGRTNIAGFVLRLAARIPFLFIAGRIYGPDLVGRFAIAVVVVELAALIATLGMKRGLAQALASTDRPHVHIVWDAMALAFLASVAASGVLWNFPELLYPNSAITGLDRWLPCIIVAIAWSDVSLAALAYRHNVKATVTARAVVEPWTISIAAWVFSFFTIRDGLVLSYVASMTAALIASLVPFLRSYGLPHGWSPQLSRVFALARANAPLAGADALEWGTRNVDRFILGVMFEPRVVGIYYMAQQVASLPQKLKTSFDPILGPVITQSLANGDMGAIARQVRQVAFWIIAAQGCLALMGSIPGEAVMGVVGPQFVSGTAALAFLLFAEVLASTGAVCESALVYTARHRNLMISIAMLGVQIGLSFALILGMRSLGWPETWAAAGPAVALAMSVTMTSVIKARVLSGILKAPVSPFRWPLVWAAGAAVVVGAIFTLLPKRLEWAELLFGEPAIAATYLLILWRWAFGPADRALFGKAPTAEEATLPNAGGITR